MKKLDVFYNGWGEHWHFGRLADNGRQLLFEYTPEALKQGLELSPINLKLRIEAFSDFPSHQMRLPGLIADSLPDGWGLLLMDRLFRKMKLPSAEISPLDRLAFLGNRAMGAFSFKPPSFDSLQHQDFKLLEIACEVQKVISDSASQALPQLALMGGSPHGARPKVLVNYDSKTKKISTNPEGQGDPWLIKFQLHHEHKEVCAIEALYTNLARLSGLETSQMRYFDLGKKLSAFGTRRFDRQGKVIRIPTHTLSGALNADFRIPSSVDYLSFLRLTRFMTKDDREVLKAFRHCVFNVIFNNRDDHPKNFSYLLDQKRNWKLSPSYDLSFNIGPGGEHQMDICGEGKAPMREHLKELAEKNGIEKKICIEIVDTVLGVANRFKLEAKKWPIRTSTIDTIGRAIQENIKRIK